MKRLTLALSMVAVLGLAACTNGGTWTPMSGGRTAGDSTVSVYAPSKSGMADKSCSKSMLK